MLCVKVDKLMKKYEGRYAEMFDRLEEKYVRIDAARKVRGARNVNQIRWYSNSCKFVVRGEHELAQFTKLYEVSLLVTRELWSGKRIIQYSSGKGINVARLLRSVSLSRVKLAPHEAVAYDAVCLTSSIGSPLSFGVPVALHQASCYAVVHLHKLRLRWTPQCS